MFYLLFILYLCICCYVISRNGFIKRSGLGKPLLISLFLVRIITGLAVGWITKDITSDYWGFNAEGVLEYEKLITTPKFFFYELINPHYIIWKYLPVNLMAKSLALLDLFTRGNYYVNSIFFNLAGFFGCIALYKVFSNIYPQKKWLLVIGCFLLPSAMVFTSAIHKDVIIFTMLGFFCHALYFSLNCRFNIKRIIILIISLLIIFMLRSYIAIALLPCAMAWAIAQKTNIKPGRVFAGVFAGGLLLLLVLQLALPDVKPLKAITAKQAEFLTLPTARTQVSTDSIYPTLQSLAKNTPQALNHTLLRPYPFEFNDMPVMNCFALEMIAYLLLFLLMLIFYEKHPAQPFIFFSVLFSLCILLIIGYIVPNMGAITRYRSIYFPFLITPVLCHINWEKVSRRFSQMIHADVRR